LIILALCLVSLALAAGPAQAVDGGPYITLDPSDGVPGTNVTVHGGNFTSSEWVDVYYYRTATETWLAEVRTTSGGNFNVTFTVPESYTGLHKVRAERSSTIYADADFTVKPGLTVSPKKGPVSTNVTVEGHGFAEDEGSIDLRYYLDGNYTTIAANIEADVYGYWKKSFVIPSSSKGNHKIDAEGEESTFAQVKDTIFEVTPGITLDKSSGSMGENITMTGNGFYAGERDITILFAGNEVETDIRADAKGYWQEEFQVPEMPKGTYTVTAEGEQTPKEAISALSFSIMPDIVLSPDEGHVGTNLTVTGRGFAASKVVLIMYENEDTEVATDTTDNKGSFDVSFAVPASQHGQQQVIARDAAGNNATAIFTMESVPPPVPELESPPEGSRVGFIGKVRPTFQWSAVSDPSRVYYSLQIAASSAVNTAGEFVNPIVSVDGLVETSYTLNEPNALSYGTYYWIVQAVDGAENASNWTAAHSFRAGLLPLWGFIAAIVAIVVLIGALVYFLVIRKRTHYY